MTLRRLPRPTRSFPERQRTRLAASSFGVRTAIVALALTFALPLTAYAGRITLAWDASPDAVSGYIIYYGTSSGVYSSSITVGNVTTYPVTNLTNGTTYFFVVKAFNASGQLSAASNQVSGTPTNTAPTLADPPNQTHETGGTVSLQLIGSDADGDTLTYSATGLPGGLSLNTSTGLISGAPTAAGSFSVTVNATDGAATATQTFTWTITAAPPPSPISQWQFDETSGTVASDATGSRNGTLTNGASWTAGRVGNAVSLDGTNDYVSLPTFNVAGSALTISAWVKSSSLPSGTSPRFVSKASGTGSTSTYWMVGQTTSGGVPRLWFRVRTGTSTTTLTASQGNLPLNQWYHVAATYDGSNMRLYLDGVQVASTAKTGTLASSNSVAVAIGRSAEGSNYMHGALDDVRIYDKALTVAQVLGMVNEAPGGNTPPTLAAPGNQSSGVGGTISLQLNGSDADGDTLTYSASGLPPGLSLNAGTGLISGNPTTIGNYSVSATVTDGLASASRSFTWTIAQLFSDDPLVSGVTPIKALHITELRARINALRSARGLPAASWTDPVLTAGGTVIKSAHILELRNALSPVYVSLSRAQPSYSTGTPATGVTVIRAADIAELRAAVTAVE